MSEPGPHSECPVCRSTSCILTEEQCRAACSEFKALDQETAARNLIEQPSPLYLDLAAGAHPVEGFAPVDRVKVTPETIVFDLVSGHRWPWKDNSVDGFACQHFIEHIPAEERQCWHVSIQDGLPFGRWVRQDLLFWFFDEAFRVAKPGAEMQLVWPSLKSTDAFRDPTHRRFLPLEFLHYLSRSGREVMGLSHYVAHCNWISAQAQIQQEPLPEEASVRWTEYDRNRLWDVQRAFSVVLRAEK